MEVLITVPFLAIQFGLNPQKVHAELLNRGILPAKQLNGVIYYHRAPVEKVCEQMQQKLYTGHAGKE